MSLDQGADVRGGTIAVEFARCSERTPRNQNEHYRRGRGYTVASCGGAVERLVEGFFATLGAVKDDE